MSLIHWSPLEDISFLKRQIDDIFSPGSQNGDQRVVTYTPAVEVTEMVDQYKVRLMLSGVDPKQINLEATDKTLIVTAERIPEKLQEGEKVHLSEFRYGKFSKHITFPEAVDTEKVQAKAVHGVLEVVLPKLESAKRKQIQIDTVE